MPQRLREILALILIALLPFHALLVTVLTKMIAGAGHAPLSYLAIWKEGVLGLILLIAMVEIVIACKRLRAAGHRLPAFDVIDYLIFGLLGLSIIIQLTTHYSLLTTNFILGFKYDFIPLLSFLILRRTSWSEWFMKQLMNVLLWVGGIVALYGIISFFLPDSFFSFLGYSDLHSLYLPDHPIAAFQQIGGSSLRRIQSVMSGPNQLGLWLLIVFALLLPIGLSSYRSKKIPVLQKIIFLLVLGAIFLTFSRAAWLGAFVMTVVASFMILPRRTFRKEMLFGAISLVTCLIVLFLIAPGILTRISSNRGHIERPLQALQQMVKQPFGMGLGTAGPATNRTSEACVMLEPTDDPSWAKDQPNLCVFLGSKQVQPPLADHVCRCPFLPENWYLQIGVELGWIGFVLYLSLVFLILKRLKMHQKLLTTNYQLLTFLAVSIAALFLHAWEDSAVAYTVWILIASVLPVAARHADA